jgi:hypothetical protein
MTGDWSKRAANGPRPPSNDRGAATHPGDDPANAHGRSGCYCSVMFGSPLAFSPLAVRVQVPPRGVPPL